MKAILYRIYEPEITYGTLNVFNENNRLIYHCCTVELPNKNNEKKISCIPEGTYTVSKRAPTKTFNYTHFAIQNVPNRDGILIHIANYVSQLKGCIAVGKTFIDINNDKILDTAQSKQALDELVKIMPDKFELTIKRLI